MIPTWLQRHLETQTGAPLAARTAKPRLCHCGAWTLVGLDADTIATTARVDPTPLTAAGELTCILTARPTYDLTRVVGRLQLDPRDSHDMRGRPPAAPGARYDVVPAHVHGQALTGPLTTDTVHAPAAAAARDLDHIPF